MTPRQIPTKKLPSNYIQRIFESLNGKYSKVYIQFVVKGRRKNNEIFSAALSLAEEKKKLDEDIQQRASLL
jgi:hypothetical protein